jgi:hypothetical protein
VAQACKVCVRPDRAAIDKVIVTGLSDYKVASRFDLDRSTVQRHRNGHLSKSLTELHRKREERRALSLLDRVEALCTEVEQVLEQVKAEGEHKLSIAALKELRSTLELVGRLTGELDTRPQVQVNVMQSPDWLAARQVVAEILAQYPGAPEELDARLLALEAPQHPEATT